MEIGIVGLSHKTAPIELRECLNIRREKYGEFCKALCSIPEISASLVVSTCNRVEVYFTSQDQHIATEKIIQFLCQQKEINDPHIRECLYSFYGYKAIQHIFRVTSSLDAMVVGEPQITGQVKEAFQEAIRVGTIDLILDKLLTKAFHAAKRVRNETAISANPVSVPYAAVELAKRIFQDLSELTVMVIGTGEMAELTVKHLIANGVSKLKAVSRTYERACEFAQKFNGIPLAFSDFQEHLLDTDILISSTSSPYPVIRKQDVQQAMKKRRGKPMFFIDIAFPRDIESDVNEINNVYLYDIDDLKRVVEANIKEREKEIVKAEAIIVEEVEEFLTWLNSLQVVPLISSLVEKSEAIRRSELEKALKKMPSLSEEDRRKIEALTSSIVHKILHEPISSLKECASSGNGYLLIEAVKQIFKLDKK